MIVIYIDLQIKKNQTKLPPETLCGPVPRHVGQQRAGGGTGRRSHSGTGGGISCFFFAALKVKVGHPTPSETPKCWVYVGWFPGWWLTYPSENYELVSWDDGIPNIWKYGEKNVPNHQPVSVSLTFYGFNMFQMHWHKTGHQKYIYIYMCTWFPEV